MPGDIDRLTAERDTSAMAFSDAKAKYDEAKQRSDLAAADETKAKGLSMPINENVLDNLEIETKLAKAEYDKKLRDLDVAEVTLKSACHSAGVPYPAWIPAPPGAPGPRTDTAPPQTLDQQVEEQGRQDRFKRMRRDGERAARGEGPRKGRTVDDDIKRIIAETEPPDIWKTAPKQPPAKAPQPKTGNKLVDDWNAFISGEMPADEAKKYRQELKQNLKEHLLDDETEDYLKAHPEVLEDPKPGQPLPPSPPPSGVGFTPQGGDVAGGTDQETQPVGAQVSEGAVAADGGGPTRRVFVCIVFIGLFALVLVSAGAGAFALRLGPFSPSGGGSGSSSTKAPEKPPAPPPGEPMLTGIQSGSIVVCDGCDPFGHFQFIGAMPSTLNVMVTRVKETGVITVKIDGAAPFITVISVGNYSVTTGTFSASGDGTVTARKIPVTSTLEGTLLGGKLDGKDKFTGTPNGPITYEIHMRRTGPLPVAP
jgi:hypothetical protein